jgi:arylsulfatase A-like enzyme
VIKPGSTSDAMVQSIDLLPTLIEIASGTVPSEIDGKSYAGVLRGKITAHRERIFTTHTNDGDMNVYPIRSVRARGFKYIRNLHPEWEHTTHIDRAQAKDGGYYWKSWEEAAKTGAAAAAVVKRYHQRPKEELYDLAGDPHEMKNVAADPKYAAILRNLSVELDAWMRDQGDAGKTAGTPRLLTGQDK